MGNVVCVHNGTLIFVSLIRCIVLLAYKHQKNMTTAYIFLGIWNETERISTIDLIRNGKPEKVYRNQVSSEPLHSFPPQPSFLLCYRGLSKMSLLARWLSAARTSCSLVSEAIRIKWRNKMTYPFYGVTLSPVNSTVHIKTDHEEVRFIPGIPGGFNTRKFYSSNTLH